MIFVWTLDSVLTVFAFVVLAIALLLMWIPMAWRQRWCKHDGGIRENRECDAFCQKCGKNLGFIGNWRSRL